MNPDSPATVDLSAECLPELALPQHAAAPPFEQWVEDEQRRSTAVRKGHRRRGIATTLKRAQVAWAAEHGYREILTSMVGGKAAMRAVNERLG